MSSSAPLALELPPVSIGSVCAARPSVDDLVASVPLFRHLKIDAPLRELVASFVYRDVSPGDVVVRRRDASDGIYLLLAGRVEVRVDGMPLARLGPGEVFGEMSLFGEATRSAEVVAMEPGLSAFLDRRVLEAALTKVPRLATNLMRALTERIRTQNGMLLSLRLAPPPSIGPRSAMGTSAERGDDGGSAPVTTAERLALLGSVPMFAEVSDARFLGRVANALEPLAVPAGTTLFREGDPGDRLYLVVEGTLRVHLDDLALARLCPGDHVGEMALLDGAPRSAAVTTTTACRFLTLAQAPFFAAIAQAPAVARSILASLSGRIRKTNRIVADAEPGDASPTDFFPETGAESPWQRDPATGRWHMPLSRTIADEVAAVTPAEPTAAEGFAEALRSDADALQNALLARREAEPSNDPSFDRLLGLVDALMARRRSPLSPRKAHHALAEALHRDVLHAKKPIELRIVLASPTARKELGDFLAVARLVRDAGFAVAPHLLVVRWENWVDVATASLDERRAAFAACVDDVRAAACASGLDARVTAIDVEIAASLGDVRAPSDFLEIFGRVARAAEDVASADTALARNLTWITGFYGRQASLGRLGPVQPTFDLAVRIAIGRRAETMGSDGLALFLTSELGQRFVACYDTSLPTLNIVLGECADVG